jgi:hypothetical protein
MSARCITSGRELGVQLAQILGYQVPSDDGRLFCSDKCHAGHPDTQVDLSTASACLCIFARVQPGVRVCV